MGAVERALWKKLQDFLDEQGANGRSVFLLANRLARIGLDGLRDSLEGRGPLTLSWDSPALELQETVEYWTWDSDGQKTPGWSAGVFPVPVGYAEVLKEAEDEEHAVERGEVDLDDLDRPVPKFFRFAIRFAELQALQWLVRGARTVKEGNEYRWSYQPSEPPRPPLDLPGGVLDGTAEGKPYRATVALTFNPLVIDEEESRAFYPVHVSLTVEGQAGSPGSWGENERAALWSGLLSNLEEAREKLWQEAPEDARSATSETGTLPTPEVRPVERRPLVPTRVIDEAGAASVTKGMASFFMDHRSIPDLDRNGSTATDTAESLFWSLFEKKLNETKVTREKRKAGAATVYLLRNVQEAEARELWLHVVKTANAENGGPGLDVLEPAFEKRNRMESGGVVVETSLTFWPPSSIMKRPPVRFRRRDSPGYLELLKNYKGQAFFADGVLWKPQGASLDGFRLAGRGSLLFTKARQAIVDLERHGVEVKKGRIRELEKTLDESLPFPDADETAVKEVRGLLADIRRAEEHIKELQTFDWLDPLRCVLWAFHAQRDAWAREELLLPDGRAVKTAPYRVIRLDPSTFKESLYPGTKSAAWRTLVWRRLRSLCEFERVTWTLSGREVDTGDRFLERLVDGLRGEDEQEDTSDPKYGLWRTLSEKGAVPSDAFFAVLSPDFIDRAVSFVYDEKSDRWLWGAEAAKVKADADARAVLSSGRKTKALTARAAEVRKATKKRERSKAYLEDSPALVKLGNAEGWKPERKSLAILALRYKTTNREAHFTEDGVRRLRPRKNRIGGKWELATVDGKDYEVSRSASGVKVDTWISKAHYERRTGPGGSLQALRDFAADVRYFVEALGWAVRFEGHDWDSLKVAGYLGSVKNHQEAHRKKLDFLLPLGLEDVLAARLSSGATVPVASSEEEHDAEDFRQAVERSPWSQGEVAKTLGVHRVKLNGWLNGKPIPPLRVDELRALLKDYL